MLIFTSADGLEHQARVILAGETRDLLHLEYTNELGDRCEIARARRGEPGELGRWREGDPTPGLLVRPPAPRNTMMGPPSGVAWRNR